MSYKSENWKEKLEQVRNHIALKEGSVEKTADEILESQIEEELKTFDDIQEVTDKEINAVKKLSKLIEKAKKDYFKIAKMGDQTLKDTKFNEKYESILKAQQEILSLIGELSNQKMMQGEEVVEEEVILEASMGDMIKKVFNTKSETEAMGIAKLLNMTDVKVALGMQKQNPKGFTKTTFAMGADNSNKDMIKDKDLMKMFKKAGVKPLPEEKDDDLMNSYRSMLEAKSFNQKDIDIVAKLTDRNEHTLSLMHIANLVGDRDAGKKLEMISKLHREYGSLHQGLQMMRDEIYASLKKQMMKYSNGNDMYNAT